MRRSSDTRALSVWRTLACVALLATAARVSAALHLTGAKPEPPVHFRLGNLPQRAPSRAGASSALTLRRAPVRILLLKVDFPPDGGSSTTGTGEWSDPSYAELGDPDHWITADTSRFVSYYGEVSSGRLAVEIVTMPPAPGAYRLPRTMRHYGNESDGDIQDLIYDAVTAATTDPAYPAGDLSLYDAVLVVHAGAGEESDVASDSSDDIWSLYYRTDDGSAIRSSVTGRALTQTLRDGLPIHEGIVMPQADSQDGIRVDPLGVWVHEFGHWLGLPDLYCTALVCLPDGAGKWSLMADGLYNRVGDEPYGSRPAQLDAWSKMMLGWLTPVEAPSPQASSITLKPVESEPVVYKLPVSRDPAASGQYFLVENRQQEGYDAGLPGHGLLVWLVDESVIGGTDCASGSTSRFCQNAVVDGPLRPGLKLVEADGDDALQKYGCSGGGIDCGNAGDPFPGTSTVASFTPQTVPPSSGYASPPWVNLRDITEDAATGDVSLSVSFGPDPPQDVTVDPQGHVAWAAPGDDPTPTLRFNVYREGVLATAAPIPAGGYQDPAPQPGTVYQVTSLDAAGNESGLSTPAQEVPGEELRAGDTRCFIATAAYGSYLDPHVNALRAFRDRELLTSVPGRAFVALYYRCSPPVAAFIRMHEAARRVTRWALTPLVAAVEHPRPFWTASGAGLCAITLRRRRGRSRAREGSAKAQSTRGDTPRYRAYSTRPPTTVATTGTLGRRSASTASRSSENAVRSASQLSRSTPRPASANEA